MLFPTSVLAALRRQRSGGSYTPAATALAWIDPPANPNALGAGKTQRAQVVDQKGFRFNPQPVITYSSSATGVATIDASGNLNAVANGSTTITAASTGLTSINQPITVAQVASTITGVASTLSTPDTGSGSFTPVAKDANNNTVAGASFTYASNQSSVLSVDAAGNWAGHARGGATVTITSGNASFVVQATVTALDHITLAASATTQYDDDPAPTLTLGKWASVDQSVAYTGTVSPTASYSTSDSSIIAVNATTGACTMGGASGDVTLSVTAGGKSAQVTVTVNVAFVLAQTPNAPLVGDAITYTASYRGTDVTTSTAFTTAAPSIVTVDAPTLTGAPSPASITQGQSNVTVTFPCTNPRSSQTLGGLPSGVTASAATVVDGTHLSFALTATAGATVGTANVYLVDSTHGNSGTQVLTVAASGAGATLYISTGNFTLVNGGVQTLAVTDGTNPVTGYTLNVSDPTKGASVSTTGDPAVFGKAESGTFTVTASKPGYATSAAVTVTCSGGLFNAIDAAGSSSTTTNGATVASLTDKSANATVYGTSTAKPTYVTSKLNGKPAIQFSSASGQYLATSGVVAAQSPATVMSFFSAVYDAGTGGTQRVLSNQDNTPKTGYRLGYYSIDNTHSYEVDAGGSSVSVSSSNTVAFGALAVVTGWRAADGFPHIRVNGTESVGTTAGALAQNTTSAKTWGSGSNPLGTYMNGGIFAAQEYSRILTAGEITQVENAMKYYAGAL